MAAGILCALVWPLQESGTQGFRSSFIASPEETTWVTERLFRAVLHPALLNEDVGWMALYGGASRMPFCNTVIWLEGITVVSGHPTAGFQSYECHRTYALAPPSRISVFSNHS